MGINTSSVLKLGCGLFAALLAIVAAVVVWPGSSVLPSVQAQSPLQQFGARVDPAVISRGQALYEAHCASCHGKNLEGEANWQTPNDDGTFKAPPHDDSGHTWHHDDQTLVRYIELGGAELMRQAGVTNFRSGMPGFGQVLSGQDIESILAFFKSNWSAQSRRIQRERTRASEQK